MQIKSIDIFHISIPVLKPLETSFGIVDKRPLLIFQVETTDGVIGIGESSPLYVPISEKETLSHGLEILQQRLPSLIGQSFDHPKDLRSFFAQLKDIPVSRLGLEGALYFAYAQSKKQTLQQIFGGTNQHVEAGASIGLYPAIETIYDEIDLALQQGLKRIKLKIKPGHDVNVVKAVRKKYPNIPLGVDANACYHEDELASFIAMADCSLMFIEQPYHADAYEAHARLRTMVNTPICLDETIRDLKTTQKAIDTSACDIINIKPARIGSYAESIEIHDLCFQHGIPLFGGGRMESGLGKFFNIALYSLPGFTYPSDTSQPLEYFASDIMEPTFTLSNGYYSFPHSQEIIEGKFTDVLLRPYLIDTIHIV